MSFRKLVTMPDDSTYRAVIGKPFWLRWLKADDVVLGETAYFTPEFGTDGRLRSPSPGHLAHAGTHVTQFRARIRRGPFKVLRWIVVWLRHEDELEAEADAYAEAMKHDDHWAAQWLSLYQRLRAPT